MLGGSPQFKSGLDATPSGLSLSLNSGVTYFLVWGVDSRCYISVAYSFREKFIELADSPDAAIRSAGYENIPIDVHPPVLPLPNLPERPHNRSLSKAVIQGSFDTVRRDYNNIFSDLIASLRGMFMSPLQFFSCYTGFR
jgi:hypothetical protein